MGVPGTGGAAGGAPSGGGSAGNNGNNWLFGTGQSLFGPPSISSTQHSSGQEQSTNVITYSSSAMSGPFDDRLCGPPQGHQPPHGQARHFQ